MTGVWMGVIGAEALSTALALIAMWVIRRKNAPDMDSLLLPAEVAAKI